jgi:hypothetical protein
MKVAIAKSSTPEINKPMPTQASAKARTGTSQIA